MLIYSVCNASLDGDIPEFTYLVMGWLFLQTGCISIGEKGCFPPVV